MPKKVDVKINPDVEPLFRQGEIIAQVAGGVFEVKTEDGSIVTCNLAQRIYGSPSELKRRTPQIGDTTTIEVNPRDASRGRVRYKNVK